MQSCVHLSYVVSTQVAQPNELKSQGEYFLSDELFSFTHLLSIRDNSKLSSATGHIPPVPVCILTTVK